MILDFSKIEETVMPAFKGGEKELRANAYVDGKNRIMYCRLVPGASIGLHTHDTSSEIIFFLQGSGKLIYDGTELRVEEGICHYCPLGHSHTLINDTEEDLLFYAVVPQQSPMI